MMLGTPHAKTLFGGELTWSAEDWTASDDRVRGGSSKSHLACDAKQAVFYGSLDIKTLGGAGFASQRTSTEDETWDLHTYDGIVLEFDLSHSDQKEYTFILKDSLPRSNAESGREQATISWEVDFSLSQDGVNSKSVSVFFAWEAFKPTYRGKKQTCDHDIDLRNIRRFSIMMRSFFGSQEGEFRLTILSIRATKAASKEAPSSSIASSRQPADDISDSSESLEKQNSNVSDRNNVSVWHWLLGKCGKL